MTPAKYTAFKVEYHANENPLKNSEKRAYVVERLMYQINNKKQPYHASLKKCNYVLGF